MEKEKKVYPKLEELLPEGKHIITVKPHQEWKDGAFQEGTHKKGTSQYGNWYIYDTKVDETWVSIFANDDNKEFFDSVTEEQIDQYSAEIAENLSELKKYASESAKIDFIQRRE